MVNVSALATEIALNIFGDSIKDNGSKTIGVLFAVA
jgi:hypothetical protein